MSAPQLSFLNSELIASSHSRCNFFFFTHLGFQRLSLSLQALYIISQHRKERTALANVSKGSWFCFGDRWFAAGEKAQGTFQTLQNTHLSFSKAIYFCAGFLQLLHFA